MPSIDYIIVILKRYYIVCTNLPGTLVLFYLYEINLIDQIWKNGNWILERYGKLFCTTNKITQRKFVNNKNIYFQNYLRYTYSYWLTLGQRIDMAIQ